MAFTLALSWEAIVRSRRRDDGDDIRHNVFGGEMTDDPEEYDEHEPEPEHDPPQRIAFERHVSYDPDIDGRAELGNQTSWFRRYPTLNSTNSNADDDDEDEKRGFFRRIKDFVMQTGPYVKDDESSEFIPNYRWLPIFSGLVVPMAIMLEIPGLTEHWYVRWEDNIAVEYQENPIILDVGLAISMASGVLANACIIARFLEKRVKLMTTIAIFSLILHDIINIIAVAVFGIQHRFDDGFNFSQAFWLTVCSTISSLFTTITLYVDLHRTPYFSKSGSGLTRKQRSLVIVWIILLTYMSIGSLCWAYLLNINFADALYFTVVSIESVGFGDFHPNSIGSQIFSLFYNTAGILNVALFIAMTRQTLIEGFENSYRRRRHALSVRRNQHREERRSAREKRERAREREARTPATGGTPTPPSGGGLLGSAPPPSGAQTPQFDLTQLSRAASPHEDQLGTANHNGPHPRRRTSTMLGREVEEHIKWSGLDDGLSYRDFRSQLAREEKKEFAAKLFISVSLFAMFWLFGILVFMKTESWSVMDSLYFCFVTFSTIGYGDVTPQSPTGRAIFVIWGLLGIGTMTILFTVLSDAYEARYSSAVQNPVFEKAVKHFNAKPHSRRNVGASAAAGMPPPPPPISVEFVDSEAQNGSFQNILLADDARKEKDVKKDVGWDESEMMHAVVDSDKKFEGDKHVTLDISRLVVNRQQLGNLPTELLEHARSFHDHMEYFNGFDVQGKGNHRHGMELPPAIQRLLDEIAGTEKMDKRLKREIVQDVNARKTLFMMSYEQTLRKMIETAERAILLLAERTQLDEHHIQHHHSHTDAATPRETKPPPLPADITEYFRPSTIPLISTLSSPFPLPTVSDLLRGGKSGGGSGASAGELLRQRLDAALLRPPQRRPNHPTPPPPLTPDAEPLLTSDLLEGSSDQLSLNVHNGGVATPPEGLPGGSRSQLHFPGHLRRKGSGSSSLSRVQFAAESDNESVPRRERGREREKGRWRSRDCGDGGGGSRLKDEGDADEKPP